MLANILFNQRAERSNGIDVATTVTMAPLSEAPIIANLAQAWGAVLRGTVFDGQGNPLADTSVFLAQSGHPSTR